MMYFPPANWVLEAFGGPIDGHLSVMGLIVLGAVLATFLGLFWAIHSARWREATLGCPVDGRTARVKMLLDPDGNPVDVRRCSLQGRRLICDKRCLKAA
jgi:hypothetical protein